MVKEMVCKDIDVKDADFNIQAKEKLRELQEQGKDPFKVTKYNRTHLSQEIKDNYEKYAKKIKKSQKKRKLKIR